jgi:hypothetical protein
MQDTGNLQLKIQEMCDCYATSDPLREMSIVEKEENKDEAAVKWLALAALHGVNQNAEKISISQSATGEVTVTAKYRKTDLPNPGGEVAGKIFETMGRITHMEGEKVKLPLSLGIREDSVPLKVKIKSKDGGRKLTLKFDD